MEMITPSTVGVVAAIVGGLLGGFAGGAAVLAIALVQPRRACPECGTPLPRLRKPTSLRQMLLGGSTCPACAAELNLRGEKVAA